MLSFATMKPKAKKQSKPISISKPEFKPHPYQKTGIKFICDNLVAGLFWDPGLGKTSTILSAFKKLKAKGMVSNMLVVAPLQVAYNVWTGESSEINKFKTFDGLKVALMHGAKKSEALTSKADIYVINPEGLSWLSRQRIFKFDMLVVDESTKFKSTRAQKFKTLKAILPKFQRRYILTGTPIPNTLEDLFGQIYILDEGRALGRYITHFRTKYFYPSGYGGYTWLPRENAENEIYERLGGIVHRLDSEDYLKLPKKIEVVHKLKLPPEALKVYKALEKEFIVDLCSGSVTSVNAAVATMKLRQIANGGIYLDAQDIDEGKRPFETIHLAKAELVKDLVDELSGNPALVAYEFHHDLARLKQVLGKDTPYIGSGVSKKESQAIQAAWNRQELPALLGQPQSMAHGLNLQAGGSCEIWHSLTYNYENYYQFMKRLWRQGAKHKVFLHFCVMEDTVDEVIMEVIQKKGANQKVFLDALKHYYST